MINIHKQHWACIADGRKPEDSTHNLAYMTHREYTKTGDELESFKKRKSTGTGWAQGYRNKDKAYREVEFDNTPVQGFKIVGSVSRWSTQNKLIQVEDPRGFVVEIPTGNLATLLKYCVVDHSEVTDECVWGKEGNNHILLPIKSDVYQKAFEQTKENAGRVSLTKLDIGDVVRFSVDDAQEWIYAGRGKAVWEVEIKQAKEQNRNNRWSYSNYYRINRETDEVVSTSEAYTDTALSFLFILKSDKRYDSQTEVEYKSTGSAKCVRTGEVVEVPELPVIPQIYLPQRMMNKIGVGDMSSWQTDGTGKYYEVSTKEIAMRP